MNREEGSDARRVRIVVVRRRLQANHFARQRLSVCYEHLVPITRREVNPTASTRVVEEIHVQAEEA